MTAWIPVIVAIFGGLGSGGLAGLLLIRRQAKKVDADTDLTEANAASTLAGVAVKLVEPLTKRLADAEAKATALNAALEAAQVELQSLRSTVERLTKELEAKSAELENARTTHKRSR